MSFLQSPDVHLIHFDRNNLRHVERDIERCRLPEQCRTLAMFMIMNILYHILNLQYIPELKLKLFSFALIVKVAGLCVHWKLTIKMKNLMFTCYQNHCYSNVDMFTLYMGHGYRI